MLSGYEEITYHYRLCCRNFRGMIVIYAVPLTTKKSDGQ